MPAPLGLGQIASKSRVWVIWSDPRDKSMLMAIVQQCLSLKCRVTVISTLSSGHTDSLSLQEVKSESIYELLPPSDNSTIFKAAYELATHWCDAPAVNEALVWNGMQLGKMAEGILPSFFVGVLRLVEGVLRWVEHERPDLVILTRRHDQTAVLFRQVMEREKIAIVFVASDLRDRVTNLLETVKGQLLFMLLDMRDVLVKGIWAKLLYVYNQLCKRKNNQGGPLAVFVGFDCNHYKHILPVAEYLQDKHWQVLVLQGLTGQSLFVTRNARRPGLSARTVDEYVTVELWLRYRAARRQIRSLWKQLDRSGALAGFFVYHGVKLWPLLRKHMQYCFYVYLPTAVRYIGLASRVIDQESPKVFVFGNDSCHRGLAIIAVARQRDVPTLVIQHGITANPWGYVPHSDKMIVWGEHSRNAIASCGVAREKLICTGAPGLDPLVLLAANETLLAQRSMAACRSLGLEEATPLVLFLTSAVSDNYQAPIVRMMFKAAKDLSLEDRFVIKLHPHETGELQERVAAEVGFRPRIVKDIDLWGIVAASKVVVTYSDSTAGLEALVLHKPVIAAGTGKYQSIYANTTGLVYQVGREDDLKASLQCLLSENFVPDSSSLEWFLGPLDGRATIRAASLVATLGGGVRFDAHESKDYKCQQIPT